MASALSSDPREAPRLARQAGFGGVVFDAFSTSLSIPDLSSSGRREFRQLLSRESQQLVGLRADLGPRGFGPGADVDRALRQLGRVLNVAAELGAVCVLTDLGLVPAPPRRPKPKPKVTPEQAGLIILPPPSASAEPALPEPVEPAPAPDPAFISQLNSALAEFGTIADRYRTSVALSSSLASFAALRQALVAANCPWYGADLDPVAILRDEWDIDEVFSALGNLTRHVRARDAIVGSDKRTKPAIIGQGSVDWARFSSALEQSGYSGAITVDPLDLADRVAGAVTGKKYLQDL
jgi:sugar phosphate isomerase/epimerase